MTSAGSVGGDERLRLFLALELPPATLDDLIALGLGEPVGRPHRCAGAPARHARVPRQPPCSGGRRDRARPAGRRRGRIGADRARAHALARDAERRDARSRRSGRRRDGARAADVTPAWRRSASTGRRRGRGCRTSRCFASASGRGWSPHCPGREHSFRPTRLLTCLDCTRPEPGTRCWNASR